MAQLRFNGSETLGSITLAVSTTGSDAPSINRPARIVKGDFSIYPFLTIQAAVDALPKHLRHTTNINVGAGSFAGFRITGFQFSAWNTSSAFSTFKLTGTRQTATPATGPATGTATSGTTSTLTLTGAGWTVDDLVGRYLYITAGTGAGNIIPIIKNTTDTITFAGYYNSAAGSVFTIQDIATLITSTVPSYPEYVQILANQGNFLNLYDLKVVGTGSSSEYGFDFVDSNGGVSRCVASSVGVGFAFYRSSSGASSSHSLALNCVSYGLYVNDCGYVGFSRASARNCGTGVSLVGVTFAYLLNSPTIIGCTTGVSASDIGYMDCRSLIVDTATTGLLLDVTDCDLRAINVSNCSSITLSIARSLVRFSTSLSGSSNNGWGLNVKGVGNVVEFQGFAPAITGTSGDITVDGTNDETWAYFSSAGMSAVDIITGARATRT